MSSVFSYVSIRYAPFDMDDSILTWVLNQYGKVHFLRHNKHSHGKGNGLLNGIRTAKMEIRKNIPSSINIYGHNVIFLYNGQNKTCFKCGRTSHMAANCNMDQEPRLNIFNLTDFPIMTQKNSEKDKTFEGKEKTAHADKQKEATSIVEKNNDDNDLENEVGSGDNEQQCVEQEKIQELGGNKVMEREVNDDLELKLTEEATVEKETVKVVSSNDVNNESDMEEIRNAPDDVPKETPRNDSYITLSQDGSNVSDFFENVCESEKDCLNEIVVAASVHRQDEPTVEFAVDSEKGIEIDESDGNESEVNEKMEDECNPFEGKWNVNLEKIGKMKLIKDKLSKEKRKERKNAGIDHASKKKKL